jgi:hypothetical protein
LERSQVEVGWRDKTELDPEPLDPRFETSLVAPRRRDGSRGEFLGRDLQPHGRLLRWRAVGGPDRVGSGSPPLKQQV